jgi:polyisoprenoid-binding protein YceI
MSTAEQQTSTTAAPTGTWSLDSVHSSIGFAVQYAGVGTFRGTFDEFDASLVEGRLEGVAKVASVRVDDPNLAGHLQSPDFFDAEQYPELRFVSKSIERDGDTVSIQGDLTIRGITQSVEIAGTIAGPLNDAFGRERVAFDVETTVNRQDHGLKWNMELPGGGQALGDDVTLTANLAFLQA